MNTTATVTTWLRLGEAVQPCEWLSRSSAISAPSAALRAGSFRTRPLGNVEMIEIILRTLLKLLDSRDISDVISRMFVSATNMS